ncbi:MAG: methionine gamma-lyase family protein [Eubacteriales bacterium]|nr:methionine gamma-lyase family protein [Eubacteriales bacterium]
MPNIDSVFLQAEEDCRAQFEQFEKTEEQLTYNMLEAFKHFNIAQRHFTPTNGYGYDDVGRDTLEEIFAYIFKAEEAIVRPHITSGTHALALCLIGLTKAGDHILSISGKPYDTLMTVIEGDVPGNLKSQGVDFSFMPLKENKIDIDSLQQNIKPNTSLIMLQRSRGYDWRSSFSIAELKTAIEAVKKIKPDAVVFVDNCYGEFTELNEPISQGADIIAGSLIKNPGGGLAPTGGYIAGNKTCIEKIAAYLTAPGLGRETGSYEASYRPFYQGLFMAPHTVCQALKTACLASRVGELLNINVSPRYNEKRSDIIQALRFEDEDKLIAFCEGIQYFSPIDSFVTPVPWAMPGYKDQVIMAAGTFVLGASIELSCDAPIRPPYIAYLQGGLTYAHGKTALKESFRRMQEKGLI